MSQFNKIASTTRDCSECLSLVLLSATTLLKIESLFNEIDRCLHQRALSSIIKFESEPILDDTLCTSRLAKQGCKKSEGSLNRVAKSRDLQAEYDRRFFNGFSERWKLKA
jgi:hypothetical protein